MRPNCAAREGNKNKNNLQKLEPVRTYVLTMIILQLVLIYLLGTGALKYTFNMLEDTSSWKILPETTVVEIFQMTLPTPREESQGWSDIYTQKYTDWFDLRVQVLLVHQAPTAGKQLLTVLVHVESTHTSHHTTTTDSGKVLSATQLLHLVCNCHARAQGKGRLRDRELHNHTSAAVSAVTTEQ